VVLIVVPAEEIAAEATSLQEAAEALGKSDRYFSVLKCASLKGVLLETCGLECVFVTPGPPSAGPPAWTSWRSRVLRAHPTLVMPRPRRRLQARQVVPLTHGGKRGGLGRPWLQRRWNLLRWQGCRRRQAVGCFFTRRGPGGGSVGVASALRLRARGQSRRETPRRGVSGRARGPDAHPRGRRAPLGC